MRRLEGRTALVTGASSGIGRATALGLAQAGASIVGVGRRTDGLEKMADEVRSSWKESGATNSFVHTASLDVRNRSAVEEFANDLATRDIQVDILVNNAGLSRGLSTIQEGNPDDWEEMIDTNVKGLLFVTRAFAPRMIEQGRGHILNIGSIAGHEVYANGNVYCATKHAVRALTQSLRLDLHGTPVRVSTIDPGLVETEFSMVRFHGDRDRAKAVYENTNPLTAADVADAVVYAATRPAHVNVAELILLASDQATATTVLRTKT